jgi:putative transposase
MAHTFAQLLTHVTFSTKDCKPHLDESLRRELFAYMGGIVRELGPTAIAINGTMDHLHMLVILPPNAALADIMRVLKTNSSRWVHQKWPDRKAFAWQTGYGAFSVSQSNREAVVRYIANQEEHHRTRTFQEEFLALLRKHGITFDERFIWE